MKTEVLSYHIQKQKTDFETIKDIISFFSFENVWLIIKGITKEEVEEFNVNMIFSYKNNFYIKLNEKNINDIIKKALSFNCNFSFLSLKKNYKEVNKEMVKDNDIWYSINFIFSEEIVNISFDSERYNIETVKNKLNKQKLLASIRKEQNIKNGMIFLFILTILSFIFAENIISIISINTEYLWTMWLWLPIPILSIILGIKYKKRGIKCKKNIIAGFIIAFLLLVFGAYTFIFPNENYEDIFKLEDIINLSLPSEGIYSITEWNNRTDHEVYFSEYKTLEDNLETSNTWITKKDISSNLEIFISPFMICQNEETCYYSVYITELEEYNSLPQENGTYHIYSMVYNKERHSLLIEEYDYNFKK